MEKHELQKLWDETLLTGWQRNWPMWKVCKAFIMQVDHTRMNDDGLEVRAYIVSLGIKRAPTEREKVSGTGARQFIGKHSLQLSEVLIDGNPMPDVLAVIDKYRWVKGRQGGWTYSETDARTRSERRRLNAIRNGGDMVMISVRERDKRHNWNVVK